MRPIALLVLLFFLNAAPSAAADWVWPVHGEVVTQYRNGDDPYAGGQHRGIDIAAAVGTPVVAAAGGQVTFAGVAGSSGLIVSMRTADGSWDLSYLHLSAASVHKGDSVDRGSRIGAVGVSGKRSVDQSHLHFGVRVAGSATAYRDPLDYLPAPPAPSPAPEPPAAPAPATAPSPAPPAASPAAVAVAPSPAALPEPVGSAAPARVHPPHPGHSPTADFESGEHFAHGLPLEHRGAPAGTTARHATRVAGHDDHQRAAAHEPAARAAPMTGPAPARATSAPAARKPTSLANGAQHVSPAHDSGPNIAWLAALRGLLAAALCLGRPDASARAARAGRARLTALLRPLARQ